MNANIGGLYSRPKQTGEPKYPMAPGGHALYDGRHYTCKDCGRKYLTLTDFNIHVERGCPAVESQLVGTPADVEAAQWLLALPMEAN